MRVGEQLATVKAMTGVLHPWSPHLNIKPGTISTTVWDDLVGYRGVVGEMDALQCYWAQMPSI